jgi:hypothetical protein
MLPNLLPVDGLEHVVAASAGKMMSIIVSLRLAQRHMLFVPSGSNWEFDGASINDRSQSRKTAIDCQTGYWIKFRVYIYIYIYIEREREREREFLYWAGREAKTYR